MNPEMLLVLYIFFVFDLKDTLLLFFVFNQQKLQVTNF